MATVGGSATTSTGHAKEHVVRAPAKPSGGPAGRNRVGGNKTITTAQAAASVTRASLSSGAVGDSKQPIGGGTTVTSRIKQHVRRPGDGRSGPGSPAGKSSYPTPGRGGKHNGGGK